MIAQTQTRTQTRIAARSTGMAGIATVFMAGLVLLFISGIAQATVLHDAAHDQRHAMAFPCH